MSPRTEFEIWRDELSGKRSNRSSWWLALVGLIAVVIAIKVLT